MTDLQPKLLSYGDNLEIPRVEQIWRRGPQAAG
jgi:hypothetical protein